MKLLVVCFLLGFGASVDASCTTQYVGGIAYTNCDNGYNSTTQRIGNIDYTNHNYNGKMKTTTCQRIGNIDYCN
jgi:hypothetical protein